VNQDENWLVAVTAGRWQKHGIDEAKRSGLKIIAVDADAKAEGSQNADIFLCMDLDNQDAVINTLKRQGRNIRGAVSFCSEAGMALAARIREEFQLPGPKPELCRRLFDKATQRRIWTEADVPGPIWKVCRSREEARLEIKSVGFPFIIKPTDSSGSRGVTKIESLSDDIESAVDLAFQFSKSGEVLLESFMDGTEFTIEVFGTGDDVHVLAVTEKKKVPGTRGTVAYELATINQPSEIVDRITGAVVDAFKALSYTEGPGHAEAILKKDGSVGLVEVAGRGGGFMVFDKLVPLASGVNIARLTAMQSVGLPTGKIEKKLQAVVLRFFPSQPGRLLAVSGFEKANRIFGVEAGCFVKVGDIFGRAKADGDRLGYILSRAETPGEAQALADQAEQEVTFEFEPFPDQQA
jgi:biotin carboxylase